MQHKQGTPEKKKELPVTKKIKKVAQENGSKAGQQESAIAKAPQENGTAQQAPVAAKPAQKEVDVPSKLVKCLPKEGKIFFLVEWKKREDGFQPPSSVVLSRELRKSPISANMLLDYYESKLVFNKQTEEQEIPQ